MNYYFFRRKITYEEGRLFQEKNGLHLFFETSAKTGLNITEVKIYHTLKKQNFYLGFFRNCEENYRKASVKRRIFQVRNQ